VLLHLLAELISRKHPNLSHVIPIALEMIVLIIVGIFVQSSLSSSEGKWIAFAMLLRWEYKTLW
jgi:uncharacterized membrane protein YfcA